MSLKKILFKTSITRKIYLYYNLYIRNKAYKKRISYSQWGEDKLIIDFFKNKKKGFYLDIGCFHPIMYNNTCLLFNGGWKGINIDLNQTSIDLFNIIRPNDFNFCEAISDLNSEEDLFIDHYLSPVNTINKRFYDSANKKIVFKNLIKKKIVTKKLGEIIKQIPNLPKIDFLNIDCEGHDYKILSSINLDHYSPNLICIETHEVNNKEVFSYNEIINFLKNYNYKIFKRCGPSTLFYKH
jgi:hypothetical protein